MDNSVLGAFNAPRGIYYIAKTILAFKRKGGFQRLPAMPEVNTDDCKDIEEYYERQRARDFARRFYREHGLPKARLYCAVLNRLSKFQQDEKAAC